MVGLMAVMTTSFKRTYARMRGLPGLLYLVPLTLGRPLSTHTSTRDSWTLTGKSGSVSYRDTAPFSWLPVHTKFVCALQEYVSLVLCKFCNQISLASKENILGVLSPFARSPGWEIYCGS